MPFVSDEQRKAAFANMHRGGGGGGGNAPRHGSTKPPKTPKPKKPKKPKVNNYGQYGTGNGYAGNFTAGLPNYSNWYQSLPNTTQNPPLTQSGSSMPGGYSSNVQIVDFLTAEQFYGLRSEEQSLWSAYYDIFVRQRDPDDGGFLQPPGTPGTITIAASMLYGTGLVNLSYNPDPSLGIFATGGPDNRDRLTVGGYNTIYQAQQEGAYFPGTPYSNSNPGNNVDSVYTQYLRDIGMIE